jgi:hypothetical protein
MENNIDIDVTLNCKTTTKQAPFDWSDAHEDILQDWKVKAFIDMWLQRESASYYASIDNFVTYPVIVIASLSSIAVFALNDNWIKYLFGVSNIFVGILTSIGQQIKASELHQQHSNIASRYSILIRAIDTCIELPRDMRPDPNVMIEKIGSEIDALNETQLQPPNYVITKFERQYGSIHQIMFGDDIAQLLYEDYNAQKNINKIITRRDEGTSGDTSIVQMTTNG